MELPSDFFDRDHRLNFLILGIFFAGLFVLALGAGLFFFKNQKSDDIQIISAPLQPSDSAQGSAGQAVVDVGGAVVNPGIYKLSSNLRVNDAIGAAGGLASGADTSKMNLAAKIGDGQKIYVPTKSGQVTSGQSLEPSQSLININSATEAELDSLPGVGPVTANKIITSRPYSSLDELLAKKAVPASVFAKIKGMITF